MDHWLKEMLASQLNRLQLFRLFMWCVFEREVSKCPHITLASLKAMTSDVMTDLGREVIIHACKKYIYIFIYSTRPRVFLQFFYWVIQKK